MERILPALKWPLAAGTVLLLPFVLMEWMNQPGSRSDFPLSLFGFLWLLSMGMVALLIPVTRFAWRTESAEKRARWLTQLVLLVVVTAAWVNVVQDQLPYFLGVPNCD